MSNQTTAANPTAAPDASTIWAMPAATVEPAKVRRFTRIAVRYSPPLSDDQAAHMYARFTAMPTRGDETKRGFLVHNASKDGMLVRSPRKPPLSRKHRLRLRRGVTGRSTMGPTRRAGGNNYSRAEWNAARRALAGGGAEHGAPYPGYGSLYGPGAIDG